MGPGVRRDDSCCCRATAARSAQLRATHSAVVPANAGTHTAESREQRGCRLSVRRRSFLQPSLRAQRRSSIMMTACNHAKFFPRRLRARVIPNFTALSHRGRREGQASADACGPPAKKMQAAGTTGAAENARPSLRDGLNAYFVLSPGTGLIAPVIDATRERWRQLDLGTGVSGPRDFTSAHCRWSAHQISMLRQSAAIASPPRLS